MRYTEIAMGGLLVVVGIMMMFGVFSLIAIMFPNSWLPNL
jgi:hypothetical protein